MIDFIIVFLLCVFQNYWMFQPILHDVAGLLSQKELPDQKGMIPLGLCNDTEGHQDL